MRTIRFGESLVLCTLAALVLLPSRATAQSSGEGAAIRAVFDRFVQYFNDGDSEAIGELYAENADRRVASGEHARGRAEVAAMYEASFLRRTQRTNPPDGRTEFEYEIRFLRPDVALVDGFYLLPSGRRGIFTVVATKEDGHWFMAAGRAGGLVD